MRLFLVGLMAGLIVALGGCSAIRPAEKYRPHENFGDGGATRCGTFNTPRQWLKPCD